MSGAREQIGRDRRYVHLLGAYIKRRFSKWRRQQEKRNLEDAPKRASYRGWAA